VYKGWEGANVKSYYELNNDPTKTCFEYKIKIKVDHKMKSLKIV
jgi:hypothetical protein